MTIEDVIKVATIKESGGDLYAMGDNGKAYGVLQIQQACLTDVNRANATRHVLSSLLGNKTLSEWVFRRYMALYARPERFGRPVTPLDMAGIWNGGPAGWRKAVTLGYRGDFATKALALGMDPYTPVV